MIKAANTGQVSRSIVIYAAAFAVAGATPFLLLPVLTKYLSPQAFGEVTAFLMLAGIIANVAGLSAHGFVSIRYFNADRHHFKGAVSSALAAVCAAHLLAMVVMALSFGLWGSAVGLSSRQAALALVAALALSLNTIFLSIYQASGEPFVYLKARLLQGAIEISFCLGLLFLVSFDSDARTLSYCLALVMCVAMGMRHSLRRGYVGHAISRLQTRDLLKFGLPMIPHIAAGTAITFVDRAMVSTVLGVESLGIYMVGMQIGLAMVVVIEPLNKALAPWLFAQLSMDSPAVRQAIVKKTYVLYAGLAVLGVLVTTLSLAFFDNFIGAEYANAKTIIPWIVVGFVFQGMYYSVVNYLFYAEKTGKLALMSSLAAVLGGVISYESVSHYGLVGAGVSFAINNGILFLLVWVAAARVIDMPWALRGPVGDAH